MITNATRQELETALTEVNKRFNDNVSFERLTPEGRRMRFTLRVKDSKGAGHRLGFTGRRMSKACWHVHGHFFDALLRVNPDVYIKPAGLTIDRNGGNWQDRNIGSQMHPLYFSEACEC